MPSSSASSFSPQSSGSLVSVSGRTLPLVAAHADVAAADGIARIVLRQTFANAHDLPLQVTYQLPLPAEAAVSGFSFKIGDKLVVGEIDRKHRARERYEEALATGHTAALVEEERDTLFTQSLGNIPPRAQIEAEIIIDLRLRWLEEGMWELRVPTTVAPRYLGEVGRVADAKTQQVDVADTRMPLRFTMSASIQGARQIESTTHPITAVSTRSVLATERNEGCNVTFKDAAGVPLDRDVVLRWSAAEERAPLTRLQVARATGSASAYALLTITPPRRPTGTVPRDLILLLDTSGSMGGLPLEQSKRVSFALVNGLGEKDSLEMISFGNSPSRWKRGATKMDASGKRAALTWLGSLQASGGTEMREGILEALRPLREGAQRQVVLVTDGLIGFEHQIVRAIVEELPKGSRVHTVGVGASVNRTLTAGAARAGRGVEVIADESEDVERITARLIARTQAPLVTDVSVQGSGLVQVATSCVPDLFAGAPVMIPMEVATSGAHLVIQGYGEHGQPWQTEITVPPVTAGEGPGALEQLFGRERAADLEMRAATGERVDQLLEAVGLKHRIATRMTSWVAITKEQTVDAQSPFVTEKMPHELPHGTYAAGFGLREANADGADTIRTQVTMTGMARARIAMPSAMPRPAAGAPVPPAAYAPPPAPMARAGMGSGAPPTGAPPPPRQEAESTRGIPSGAVHDDQFEADFEEKDEGAAAPAKPKKDDASFFDRMKNMVFGEPEAKKRKGAAIGGPGGALHTGRIVLRNGGQIIFVITLSANVEWNEPKRATLVMTDGTRLSVDVTMTPGPSSLPRGVELRIAVALPHPVTGAIAGVELDNGETVTIAI